MAKKPLQLVKEISASDVGSTPPGLGEHGLQMWCEVQREFQITDVGGRLLLAQCCHAADMVVRLRERIDQDGLMIEMRSGWRAHPALKDELGFRCFITSTLRKLGIVDEPVQSFGGKYKKYGD
jgi:hypothetical protein